MCLAQAVGHSNFAGVNTDLWLHYSWLDWFSSPLLDSCPAPQSAVTHSGPHAAYSHSFCFPFIYTCKHLHHLRVFIHRWPSLFFCSFSIPYRDFLFPPHWYIPPLHNIVSLTLSFSSYFPAFALAICSKVCRHPHIAPMCNWFFICGMLHSSPYRHFPQYFGHLAAVICSHSALVRLNTDSWW